MAELQISSSADKFWASIEDSVELPICTAASNKGIPFVRFMKKQIDLVDEENKIIAFNVTDGDLLSLYKKRGRVEVPIV
ncbi:hypothetical protein HPP92_009821 [Vanilla planifolia]|uniref:Uncharacterized protein n=1 Tax=Vanilla planifolia TaxID=51239 RepID=A0A835REM3_VANPL|nr:hypothetical protein HPP92_009821 [Vanilla planifolia]